MVLVFFFFVSIESVFRRFFFCLLKELVSNYLTLESVCVPLQHLFNVDVTMANKYLPNRPYIRQTRLYAAFNYTNKLC